MTHINLNYKNKSWFLRQQLLGNTIRGPDLVTLEVIRSQTPSLQTSSTVGVKSRRALFGQICLVIRSSDFGFYTQMISVKREILIDDSLRLNAMQGHGLEDADMPASQWRLGGKFRTF